MTGPLKGKKLNAIYIVQIQCIVYKSLLMLRNFFGYVMSLQYNNSRTSLKMDATLNVAVIHWGNETGLIILYWIFYQEN